jgi:serine/threonine-protein kinase
VSSSTTTTTNGTPGNVVSQNPSGGTSVVTGSTVSIVVAKAPTTVNVPDVKGLTQADATSQLTKGGFKVVTQTTDVLKQKNDGIVLSQTPSANSSQKKGTTVVIVVGHLVTQSTTTTTPSTTTTTPSTTTTTGR